MADDDTPRYKVHLTKATLAGFHPKKATKTLKGEEHTPPMMTLVIDVDLDTIEPHMRDLITVYRYGGKLGQADGPGIALDFPTRAEQRRLWDQQVVREQVAPQAPGGEAARNGATGDVSGTAPTPIGSRKRVTEQDTAKT